MAELFSDKGYRSAVAHHLGGPTVTGSVTGNILLYFQFAGHYFNGMIYCT
jgi:hypothetical protein